jgi:hypothetical protein
VRYFEVAATLLPPFLSSPSLSRTFGEISHLDRSLVCGVVEIADPACDALLALARCT